MSLEPFHTGDWTSIGGIQRRTRSYRIDHVDIELSPSMTYGVQPVVLAESEERLRMEDLMEGAVLVPGRTEWVLDLPGADVATWDGKSMLVTLVQGGQTFESHGVWASRTRLFLTTPVPKEGA